jgi:carboxyl-terminal processing protease
VDKGGMMSRFLLLALVSSAVLAFLPFTAGAEDKLKDAPKKSQAEMDDETYRQLNLFGEVFERVRAQYVDQVEDEVLIENAINGMLSSLDPHSGYLNDKALQDMQVQTRGEFGGLGIEVTQEDGLVKVVTPIDDTPG